MVKKSNLKRLKDAKSKKDIKKVEKEVDKIPVLPNPIPSQVANIVNTKGNPLRKREYTLRNRINLWFCDRLGITSVHDFDDLFEAVDTFFVFGMRRFGEIDNFVKAQASFDKSIAEAFEKKKHDDAMDKESDRRNVYG